MRRARVLCWHVHGSWMTSFVAGDRDHLIPTTRPDDPWGRGRAGRPWPSSAMEVSPSELRHADIDVAVVQRAQELDLVRRWTGRRPGVDIPVVYVEHNTPTDHAATTRHPVAHRDDIPLVHVTHTNALMWDNGLAPVRVVEHGIADPGHRYTGELPRAATMINEPRRRWRITGTDLLAPIARGAPVDLWGIDTDGIGTTGRTTGLDGVVGYGDVPAPALHEAVARRRVYVHTARWTSLGLSLIEAMAMGMPVVAVAATEAVTIPPEAGTVSAVPAELAEAAAALVDDPTTAELRGKVARTWALDRFGLDRFTREWDTLLAEVIR
ncbi:MAG: glycosyltransferase [Gordonia paraffinivorans]